MACPTQGAPVTKGPGLCVLLAAWCSIGISRSSRTLCCQLKPTTACPGPRKTRTILYAQLPHANPGVLLAYCKFSSPRPPAPAPRPSQRHEIVRTVWWMSYTVQQERGLAQGFRRITKLRVEGSQPNSIRSHSFALKFPGSFRDAQVHQREGVHL